MLATEKQTQAMIDAFRRGTCLKYKKGEYIIRPGETLSAVFYIESGIVKAYDITKYGEENLLSIRKSHEIFPLIWANTGEGRNVIYQVLTPAVVYRLTRKQYQEYLGNSPDSLVPIFDIALEMYRIHSERIMSLEYRTVRERLISFLLVTAQRFGVKSTNGILLDIPLRQQDIASSINATRETTGRELAILEQKNLIIVKRSLIELTDPNKLKTFL
jgi:CRP-like cAMP-binding protein